MIAAKISVEFSKQNEKLIVLGGSIGSEFLDASGIQSLATLPSLDELRGQIVGLLKAPASKVARVIQTPAGHLARVLAAYNEKSKPAA